MTFIGISELQTYEGWGGKTALDIKQTIKILPYGWNTVFQTRSGRFPSAKLEDILDKIIPPWANRVRNYFNETPQELRLLPEKEARKEYKKLPLPGILSHGAVSSRSVKETQTLFNLSRYVPVVYKDRSGNIWFLMTPGAGIYHTGDGHPGWWKSKTAQVTKSHDEMPFKLVSPDGTGGSSEVIIKNLKHKSSLGEVNKWTNIISNIDWDIVTRGSYNYAETLVRGFTSHSLNDVDPHEKMKKGKGYINPPPFSPLGVRFFPEKLP